MHHPPAPTRPVSLCLALGWVPLICFVVWAAFLGRIGADARTFQVAYCLGFLGYLVLVWTIARSTDGSGLGRWRWWLLGCIALRATLLVMQPSDDLHRYVWEGRVQLAGFNPYLLSPDDPQLAHLRTDDWSEINHPDYPAIYGPIAQLQFRIVAAVQPTLRAMKFLHVVWDTLILLTLGACLKRAGRPIHLAMVYGLCPLVLTSFGIEGHVDALMLLFWALTTWAVLAKRLPLAGVLLGLAIATKVVAVVLWPWFLVRHWRAALIAGVVAGVGYLPFLSAGSSLFESLLRFSAESEFFSLLGAAKVTLFDTRTSRLLAAVLLGVVLFVLAWRRDNLPRYAVGATGALLMLAPVVHFWYLTWVLLWLPLALRVRWIVAGFAMAVYFEAALREQTTGVWLMPPWAPILVWSSFAVAWLAEALVNRRRLR